MPNLMGNGTGGVVAHQYINSNFFLSFIKAHTATLNIQMLNRIMLIYCALFIWGGSPTAEAMDLKSI